jgi:hypothetical protein
MPEFLCKKQPGFPGNPNDLHRLQQKHAVVQLKTSDDELAFHLLQQFSPERTWNKLLIPYHSHEDLAPINRILTSNLLGIYAAADRKQSRTTIY